MQARQAEASAATSGAASGAASGALPGGLSTPFTLRAVEAALLGKRPDPAAADQISFDIKPIDDVRSTAEYRLSVARGVVRAWLEVEGRAALR